MLEPIIGWRYIKVLLVHLLVYTRNTVYLTETDKLTSQQGLQCQNSSSSLLIFLPSNTSFEFSSIQLCRTSKLEFQFAEHSLLCIRYGNNLICLMMDSVKQKHGWQQQSTHLGFLQLKKEMGSKRLSVPFSYRYCTHTYYAATVSSVLSLLKDFHVTITTDCEFKHVPSERFRGYMKFAWPHFHQIFSPQLRKMIFSLSIFDELLLCNTILYEAMQGTHTSDGFL
jgi:hypothetical protein